LSVGQENGDIADTLQQRDVAMATIFVFLYVWCTLAPPGEYDWIVRVRRRFGLMSSYSDHLFFVIIVLSFRPTVVITITGTI